MKKYTILLIIFALLPFMLICCGQRAETKEKDAQIDKIDPEQYLKTVEELKADYFNNYWEIETATLNQLQIKGADYFVENNCYEILGKFESTLEYYCQICETLDTCNTADLLTSYLHLNDTANVRKQYESMQHEANAFIYKDFSKYEDSGEKLEGKHVSIKFDYRVEPFANALFDHVDIM